jgi:hypothetical protein
MFLRGITNELKIHGPNIGYWSFMLDRCFYFYQWFWICTLLIFLSFGSRQMDNMINQSLFTVFKEISGRELLADGAYETVP